MRLEGADPDIQTIISRIRSKEIDLQPDFQRGEVWSDLKKRRLVDSILRGWHIPPIHVIDVKASGKEEVLDGQQRLVSIRDFANGIIRVDGYIQPLDEQIRALDGLTYESLPDVWRRKFDRFTIRIFRIVDYKPGEPAELFYRLNQPTHLTAPEQRNAFFGPARQQVKDLVHEFEQYGVGKEYIGFSNSRMAYDDVVSRLCYSLERGTLTDKVTAPDLADRYRADLPFPPNVISTASSAIRLFGDSKQYVTIPIHLNKATLYSWLWFVSQSGRLKAPLLSGELLGTFLTWFEGWRATPRYLEQTPLSMFALSDKLASSFVAQLMLVYNDRASSRVADVSSVLSRDVVIWILYIAFLWSCQVQVDTDDSQIDVLRRRLTNIIGNDDLLIGEEFVSRLLEADGWGKLA